MRPVHILRNTLQAEVSEMMIICCVKILVFAGGEGSVSWILLHYIERGTVLLYPVPHLGVSEGQFSAHVHYLSVIITQARAGWEIDWARDRDRARG